MMNKPRPPLEPDTPQCQAELGSTAFHISLLLATKQLEARVHLLEEERDNLQKLVCHLLRKNECLRQQLHSHNEDTDAPMRDRSLYEDWPGMCGRQ